jgi:hypothetical protein
VETSEGKGSPVNELIRFAQGSTQARRPKTTKQLIEDTKLAALKIDAIAALAARTMDRVVDIDQYRRDKANGDETLNAVLTRIEMTFITKVEGELRGFGSVFQ